MEKQPILLEHSDQKLKDWLNVNWCLTNICNLACSYCPDSLHNGTQRGATVEVIKKFVDRIISHYHDKNIFFEFTGGEVTYYKHFLEVAEYIKSRGCDLGIISNGTRKVDYWEKLRPNLDHICISYHSETNYPDDFYNSVKFLSEKVTTHVNVMMNPEKFYECLDLAKKIAKDIKGVSIALQPLFEEMAGAKFKYDQKQEIILEAQMNALLSKKELDEHWVLPFERKIYRGEMKMTFSDDSSEKLNTPDILVRNLHDFRGWKCHGGVENLAVDLSGNILRAWCGIEGVKIGNINDENIQFPTEPIICTAQNCFCGFDIMSTKIR